jgi:RNA polymerase sigma-70 factor, ECF subfamily
LGTVGNAALNGSGAAMFVVTSRTGDRAASGLPERSRGLVDASLVHVSSPPAAHRAGTTFEAVVERYQAEIYRYAVRLTRDRDDADDLYQETLLKAYRAFGRLDRDANHRAWLYRIATNTFLSDRRKRVRFASLDDAVVLAVPAVAVDHAAGLDARDVLREVLAVIDGLPPKQRAALTLRKNHELGYAEIAAVLGTSEQAARACVYQALRKLRDRFGDGPTSPPGRAVADPW